MCLFSDGKRQNCFSWKNSRFLYNGKMVKKFLVHKMRVRSARKISMLECKHYTQTQKNTHSLTKGEYVLIGISPEIPTRWYAGHNHLLKFIKFKAAYFQY